MMIRFISSNRKTALRGTGNALIIAVIILSLLLAFSAAFMKVVVANQQSAHFHDIQYQLREYAEAGLDLAVHEFRTGYGGGDGNIGTDIWDSDLDDLGADGVGGTGDRGEKDGIPTLGEGGILPISLGPNFLGTQLFTYSEDPVDNVRRVVATAYIPGKSSATLSMYVRMDPFSIPRVGAMIVHPDALIDLKGNAFTVNGNDTDPDGSRGSDPAIFGIATTGGDISGENADKIILQIAQKEKTRIVGLGKSPSVGEHDSADIEAVLKKLTELVDTTVDPGTHTDFILGSEENYKIGLCTGDLHMSGSGAGYGALVVRGDLVISGTFTFSGILLVEGNVRLTGGGGGVQVTGGLIVGSGFTSDPQSMSVNMSGTADIKYSSEILNTLEAAVSRKGCYVVYWEGRL